MAPKHGGEGGGAKPDCIIPDGDMIKEIKLGTAYGMVCRLEFITSTGVVCGPYGGKCATATLSHDNYHLSHLSGTDDQAGVSGDTKIVNLLKFHWVHD